MIAGGDLPRALGGPEHALQAREELEEFVQVLHRFPDAEARLVGDIGADDEGLWTLHV